MMSERARGVRLEAALKLPELATPLLMMASMVFWADSLAKLFEEDIAVMLREWLWILTVSQSG